MEKRMYGLVPYNLSPIQQGIQFGHAVVEYSISNYAKTKDYKSWSKEWKTFIILNGGTTNWENGKNRGTLNNYINILFKNDIKCACFSEPDLGNQLTAVVFIVDERVFKPEKYPNVKDKKVLFLREFLKQFKLA